jgi:predicted DNA-binding antitoxin AbrB/MazE fold protein
MSQIIEAIFENGVFKPLQTIPLKEHQKVEIKVVSLDDWRFRFDRLIQKIHRQAVKYSPQEIESDISQAIEEAKEAQHSD